MKLLDSKPTLRPWDGRTPQGVRGLKYKRIVPQCKQLRRTPQGVRGLKYA